MSKKTVVIGASDNVDRYSNIATKLLLQYEHEVVPVGLRSGKILHLDILTEYHPKEGEEAVDTVTLYVGPKNQMPWVETIRNLKPKRIIMNPGTENKLTKDIFESDGIEVVEACTLVMLRTNQY